MDEEDRMIARLQQRLWKRGLVEYKKEYREFYMPKNKPGAVKIPIIMPQDKSWRHNWAAVYDLWIMAYLLQENRRTLKLKPYGFLVIY